MLRFLWNLLAVIGLAIVVGVIATAPTLYTWVSQARMLDSRAFGTYKIMATKLLETGSIAEATVWKVPVDDGLTFEEVDESIKSIAIEQNIKDVGQLPLSTQVEAMLGETWRKVKIYLYCNPLTAAKMMDFDDAYAAYMPCRVTLVEDKTGRLWIYSLDMDMMLFGGRPLPPELMEEATRVKDAILAVLERGAKGEF